MTTDAAFTLPGMRFKVRLTSHDQERELEILGAKLRPKYTRPWQYYCTRTKGSSQPSRAPLAVNTKMFPSWNWSLIAVSVSFHGAAILSTLFRLWYRWHTILLWWDDAWAALACLADVAFLIAALLEQPLPHDDIPRFFTVGNWIVSFAYPTLMWAAKISILISMVRVSNPEGMLRHVVVGTGILFGIMGIVMFALRILLCITDTCLMTLAVFISQIAMDSVADLLLSALPIWSLRYLRLGHKQKILISSIFLASLVIDIITVAEAVAIFQSFTSGSIVFEHVKVACAMIVCNLLVIVTFAYRILHKDKTDIGDATRIVFTTVDLSAFSGDTNEQGTCVAHADMRDDKIVYSAFPQRPTQYA